ncbi:transferrin-binding protein-like solute binding protein [Actinobacillus equuli]|uniref:transferrin-binding protein-like solute binding protein n=1 Tax=Actinobacillus equuli TaxID=718 RepID=UPI00244672BF|nr:transferrin-binding protein-like solute binding protein [Actinobacillus equuli]WGE84339.1 transferrin-binding protein-like solute binding protein [Actinobacillus equuli subsp. equuli]
MKTLTKISLAALSMAIAACSSGGGSGSKNSALKPKVEQKQELKQGQKQQAPKSDADKSKQNTPKSDVNEPKKNGPQLEGNDLLQGVPKTENRPEYDTPKTDVEEPKQQTPKTDVEEPKQQTPKTDVEEPKQQTPKTDVEEPKQQTPKTDVEEPKQQTPKTDVEEPKQQAPKIDSEVPKHPVPDLDTPKTNIGHTVKGKSYILTVGDDSISLDFNAKPISSEKITQLMIDGKTLDVSTTEPGPLEYFTFKGNNILSDDKIFSNVKYGSYKLDDRRFVYFIQGKPTALSELPKTGTFEYKGYYFSHGTNRFGDYAKFKADFDKKNLEGIFENYYQNNYEKRNYHFNVKIDGNHFYGTKGTAIIDGYFYGKDADELGGTYDDKGEDIQHIFGGKKVIPSSK